MGKRQPLKGVPREKLLVPPGFVSLTAFTLKRKAADPMSVNDESEPGSEVCAPMNNVDIEKFKASFVHKPWMCFDQFDCVPQKCDSDRAEIDTVTVPVSASLPKGVSWGCPNCPGCVKVTARCHPKESCLPKLEDAPISRPTEEVTARCHPKESCLPKLEDAPIFRPTEEEFKDTLKYIAKIRPTAESYGICRIVPPLSWRPPPSLPEYKKATNFATRVQKIDGLRHFYFNHEQMEKNLPKVEYGPEFTMKSFKKCADDFKAQYFADNGKGRDRRDPLIARIEGEYWRIVENPSAEVKVLCGASLGDQAKDIAKNGEYVESGWNLKNIHNCGSLLPFGCYNNLDILFTQLFIGMCFASKCWRNEEHHLYSLSYLHFGDPKVCYGVPGRYCFKFLEIVKKMYPHLSRHPQLIHELVPQLSPSMLVSEGIPVYRCVQNPLEFVVTFPGAYWSEFSCGFNFSESVCFAPFDWLPHGQNVVELYAEYCLKTSISHDKLLLGAAIKAVSAQWESLARKNNSTNNRLWTSVCGKDGILTRVLKSRVRNEALRRKHLCDLPLSSISDDLDVTTKLECTICSYDLFLSAVSCSCDPNRYSCPRHANQLCSCPWSSKRFFFRYGITELSLLVEALHGNLKAIHSWTKNKVQQQQLDSGVKSSQKNVSISPVQNAVILICDDEAEF